MSDKGNDQLRKMYQYAVALQDYVARHDLTPELLGSNQDYQWAVVTPLMVIGECAATIRRLGEDAGPDIIIGDIAGMRNRLAHDYDGTDWSVVEEVVFQDVPQLVKQIEAELLRRGITSSQLSAQSAL